MYFQENSNSTMNLSFRARLFFFSFLFPPLSLFWRKQVGSLQLGSESILSRRAYFLPMSDMVLVCTEVLRVGGVDEGSVFGVHKVRTCHSGALLFSMRFWSYNIEINDRLASRTEFLL